MVEVIYGKDLFLVNEVKENLMGKLDYEVYEFETSNPDFHFDHFLEAVQTVSLFGNPRFVFLNVTDDKKIDKLALIELLKSDLDVKVVLAFEKRIPLKDKLGKAIKDYAEVHLITTTKEKAFNKSQYLDNLLKSKQIKMTPVAKNMFLQRIGEDLSRMNSELDKLALLDREIDLDDVEEGIAQDLQRDVFALANALLDKKHDEAFRIYHSLLTQKNDPLNLGPLVASSLRTIYQVETLRDLGYGESETMDLLGISKGQYWVVVNRQIGKVFNIGRYLSKLSEIDQKAKLGLIDRFVAFELFMLEIMQ